MLERIYIKNIALISRLEAEFYNLLTILSGETGAGKSIIVDSLNFVIGAKADKTMIKSGETTGSVEAVFFIGEPVISMLMENGIDAEDGKMIIHRSINVDGRSDNRINGRSVTVAFLRSITSKCVDMHGQHEHQRLLRVSEHKAILDGSITEDLKAIKAEYSAVYTEYRSTIARIASLGGSETDRERRMDILSYQINEIEASKISEAEYDSLNAERTRLINIEKIANSYSEALECLKQVSSLGSLGASALGRAAKYDPEASGLCDRLNGVLIELDDISAEADSNLSACSFSQSDINKLESRIDKYKDLLKKYGRTVSDVLNFLSEAEKELGKLKNSAEELIKLNERRTALFDKLLGLAGKISQIRKDGAHKFEAAIVFELNELGMKNAAFTVEFNKLNELTSDGFDDIEFLFSANAGEPLKPLSKIISGGEMSRFCLAIKVLTAHYDNIDTMIFDEIDTGISGAMGRILATKLAKISRYHQVIAVSHLAQVVAMADNNYVVEKSEQEGRTETRITLLDDSRVPREVGRLVGEGMSDRSEDYAAELVGWCRRFKNNI